MFESRILSSRRYAYSLLEAGDKVDQPPDNGLKRRRMRRYIAFGIAREIREMIWSVAHVGIYCQRAWQLIVWKMALIVRLHRTYCHLQEM